MHSTRLLVALLLISAPLAVSQTTPTEAQTLQSILSELRQLRHDSKQRVLWLQGHKSHCIDSSGKMRQWRVQRSVSVMRDQGLMSLGQTETKKRSTSKLILLPPIIATRRNLSRGLKM